MTGANVDDPYLTATQHEADTWRKLAACVRQQRDAILRRQVDAVWASQDLLQHHLQQVAAASEAAAALRAGRTPGGATEVEHQITDLRLETRRGLQLNHELLQDICSYLDMMREVILPTEASATYQHPQSRGPVAGNPPTMVSRTA